MTYLPSSAEINNNNNNNNNNNDDISSIVKAWNEYKLEIDSKISLQEYMDIIDKNNNLPAKQEKKYLQKIENFIQKPVFYIPFFVFGVLLAIKLKLIVLFSVIFIGVYGIVMEFQNRIKK